MKIRFISAALLLVLTTMSVSCQKETQIAPQNEKTEVGTVYTVRYAVNGVTHTEYLYTDADMTR